MEVSAYFWLFFNIFVIIMLALDLGVFHKNPHEIRVREALVWSLVWIILSFIFNGIIWAQFGEQKAIEYLTGYLIEKSLSIDNIFVIALLFGYFHVPSRLQHKVLFWGIIGAIVLRAAFIFAGVALLEKFHWTIYLFGGVLVYTGIKMITEKDKKIEPEKNPVVKLFRKIYPVTESYRGDKFFVRENGRKYATPLFIALILIEFTDLVFAVDSIPAILAITQDQFIVYTSNIFAILGLRSLYFALADIINRFKYLSTGLAVILMFVGTKMVIADFYKLNTVVSLVIIVLILAVSTIISMVKTGKEKPKPEDSPLNID
ncbi:MAG: TerC family protein [Chloroflexota bacterium]